MQTRKYTKNTKNKINKLALGKESIQKPKTKHLNLKHQALVQLVGWLVE